MHCGPIFRIEFSYTDRVRHNFARIGSFSKFSIFRKFAFVFISGFTIFAFVFVFKCKSRKRLRSFSTVFILSGEGCSEKVERAAVVMVVVVVVVVLVEIAATEVGKRQ
jgi:hypothetical protein